MENYYEVLGASSDQSQEQIKRAFRRRAKELHPDSTHLDMVQAAPRMRLLLEAYHILGDQERRADYDRAHRYAFRRPEGFDYRAFLRSRNDSRSLAKLVLHDLMHSRDREALATYAGLEERFDFDLEGVLNHGDYMDCAYLLAEALERDEEYDKACELYLRVCHAEAARPYYRHFILEVMARVRDVACFKMAGKFSASDSVRRIEDLIDLNLSDCESAFLCKRIAEIYSGAGDIESARSYLQRALQFDEGLSGVQKLRDRVGLRERQVVS